MFPVFDFLRPRICTRPAHVLEHHVHLIQTHTCIQNSAGSSAKLFLPNGNFGLWTLEELFRGNGVTLRTQKVIQGGDNGHVGRPCEVSLAPPCPELFCELRGLCRHSYFGPRTCGRSERPSLSKWWSLNPGFQRNLSPP